MCEPVSWFMDHRGFNLSSSCWTRRRYRSWFWMLEVSFWRRLEEMNQNVEAWLQNKSTSQRWEDKPDGKTKKKCLTADFMKRVVTFSATWQAVLLMEARDEEKTRRSREQRWKIWATEEERSGMKRRGNKCLEDGNMGTQMKDGNHINHCCQMKTLHRSLSCGKNTQRAFFYMFEGSCGGKAQNCFHSFCRGQMQRFLQTAGKKQHEHMNDMKNRSTVFTSHPTSCSH